MDLLVCATGRCLWDDLERLGPWDGHWMAVNFTGMLWKRRWDHWATMHPELFAEMAKLRELYRDRGEYKAVQSYEAHAPRPDHTGIVKVRTWPFKYTNSGCFAARVGLELSYDRIVLAGCPHDQQGHFFQPEGEGPLYSEINGTSDWEAVDALSGGRIRSLSGYTRALFGAPEEIA